MLRKMLKIVGITLGVIVGTVAVLVLAVYFSIPAEDRTVDEKLVPGWFVFEYGRDDCPSPFSDDTSLTFHQRYICTNRPDPPPHWTRTRFFTENGGRRTALDEDRFVHGRVQISHYHGTFSDSGSTRPPCELKGYAFFVGSLDDFVREHDQESTLLVSAHPPCDDDR